MPVYSAPQLIAFAEALLNRAGLEAAKSAVVAATLVEGDLLGHDTYGLALLVPYLDELGKGTMKPAGHYRVVHEAPATALWDGERLPGPWLVEEALADAARRADAFGTGTIAIRRSHHIACLAAYLERPARAGYLALLSCSDPASASVAAHGGLSPVFTPDPIAAAWPTAGDPVILDISASITTNGMTQRLHREGRRTPGAWMQSAAGVATDDPAVLFTEPRGTLLPTGGVDHGHKGFALALLVEALTGGLAGHSRDQPIEGWGASVFVQLQKVDAFAGTPAFTAATEAVATRARTSAVPAGQPPVRLPGARGLARKRAQLANGVSLYPGIMSRLTAAAERLAVTPPEPLSL